MTQEEKQLLLKDLCARLPYGVKVYSDAIPHEQILIGYIPDIERYNIKPYLRPMSSMTEEERKYISDKCGFSICGPIGGKCGLIMPVLAADWLIDFYNEHHLDHRGLIPMGLALKAPEGMYKLNK